MCETSLLNSHLSKPALVQPRTGPIDFAPHPNQLFTPHCSRLKITFTCHPHKDFSNSAKCATRFSPNVNCKNRIPVPKTINGNPMTGTKQLLGHYYRLLNLLRQIINPGRPIPTNSIGKKPY